MKVKSKSRKIIFGVFALLAFGFGVKLVLFPTKYVPPDFIEARNRGAEVASQIVYFSGSVIKDLTAIANYDKKGDSADALILIANQLIANRKNEEASVKLASSLEKMARFISKIQPAKARQAATTAVGAEVALVSRLVGYNDYLKQLFEVLKNKFDRGYPDKLDAEHIDLLISKINEEASAINDFNRRFTEALAEFDKLVL